MAFPLSGFPLLSAMLVAGCLLHFTAAEVEDISVTENGLFRCGRITNESETRLWVAPTVTQLDFVECNYVGLRLEIMVPERSPTSTAYLHVSVLRMSFTFGWLTLSGYLNFDTDYHGSTNVTNLHMIVTDSNFTNVSYAFRIRSPHTVRNVVMMATGTTTITANVSAFSVFTVVARHGYTENVTLIAGSSAKIQVNSYKYLRNAASFSVRAVNVDNVRIFVGCSAQITTIGYYYSLSAGVAAYRVKNLHIDVGGNAVVHSDSGGNACAATLMHAMDLTNVSIFVHGHADVQATTTTTTVKSPFRMSVVAAGVELYSGSATNLTILARDSVRGRAICEIDSRCSSTVFGVTVADNGLFQTLNEIRVLANTSEMIVAEAKGKHAALFGIVSTQSDGLPSLTNLQIAISGPGTVNATAISVNESAFHAILGVAVAAYSKLQLVVKNVSITSSVAVLNVKSHAIDDAGIGGYRYYLHAIGGLASQAFCRYRPRSPEPTCSAFKYITNVRVDFGGNSTTTIRVRTQQVNATVACGGIAELWTTSYSDPSSDVQNVSIVVRPDAVLNVNTSTSTPPQLGSPTSPWSSVAVLGVASSTQASLVAFLMSSLSLGSVTVAVAGTFACTLTSAGNASQAVLGASATMTLEGDHMKMNNLLNASGLRVGILPNATVFVGITTVPSSALAVGGVASLSYTIGNHIHLDVDWSGAVVELLGAVNVAVTLDNASQNSNDSALAVAGMSAVYSNGSRVAALGAGRKLVVCGPNIRLVGTPADAFTIRSTTPATEGVDEFGTSNCPAATVRPPATLLPSDHPRSGADNLCHNSSGMPMSETVSITASSSTSISERSTASPSPLASRTISENTSPSVMLSRTLTVVSRKSAAAVEAKSNSSTISTGALIGVVLAGVAVLALLIVGLCRSKYRGAGKPAFVPGEQRELQTGLFTAGTHEEFVGAARQEELVHVQVTHSEVAMTAADEVGGSFIGSSIPMRNGGSDGMVSKRSDTPGPTPMLSDMIDKDTL